ncbi:MAG: hypothetical protein JWQ27_1450 [Ferruginibacter sp.]|nr:hypothetical protein [Ferruginibacter sp.]
MLLLKISNGGRLLIKLSLSMNYLAHAYLSFADPQILVGNMISDFVKGKKQYDYPAKIHAGIKLHREIDNFTDSHPSTAAIKAYFRPQYRLYSGAFADIVYDYFLANDDQEFLEVTELMDFTQATFDHLEKYPEWLGEKFGGMFPYMKSQNWLYHYREEQGIQKSFEGMRRRAAYLPETTIAFDLFRKHKNEMSLHYREFFPSVKTFAAHTLNELLKT